MKSLLKFLTASAMVALPCMGHSTDIPSSSSVAVYVQNSAGNTVCSFLAASASYQVSNTLNTSTGYTGTGAGKAAFGPLVVEKSVDNCSSMLLANTVSGVPFAHVFVVIAPPSGSTGQSTFVIAASLASILSFTDSTSSKLKLEETVSFTYGGLAIAETSGTSIVGNCYGFDLATSKMDTNGCGAISTFLNSRPALPTTY